ncbi:ABC transporter substrate-binding protein [Siculibacillus lacustris]|uniref:ABC transporter substrate-binding protein n=1 Tax=Siculibacillus lacustris TaxID=1549641 RepID=A0A4V2KTF2_9HYPH|nr:ABC transporter substrate-binding protein [Siculibacillus lacustris]TBW36988.1 ABC transporter substrate-binding protein [Siculibacillus lacustris]
MRTLFRSVFAGLAMLGAVAAPAAAETEIVVHYPMPGFFKDVMEKISTEYVKTHPDVKITFATPSATYEEGLQLMLRQAGSAEMPDVSFIGLNRLRVLAERGVGVDLKPFVEKDDMGSQGFSPRLLKLAEFGGKQMGLAFATSNPIFYYNADLVKKAGGDPENPPKTWDEVLKLSAKIAALGDGTIGMSYRWQGDDWMFSALLFGHGGTFLSADEKKVAFGGPEGLASLELIDRMVKEGKMPALTADAQLQAFYAGKVGMMFWTTGGLRGTINGVGGKFDLRTTKMPVIDAAKGRLPTGGNAAVMFTTDAKKQAAVYDFIKFAAGPFGSSVVVPGTGYVPNNELAPKDDRYLGKFYQENPLFRAGLSQMDIMIPWYSFPGNNGVKVTNTIVDNLARLVEQKVTPEQARDDMVAEVTKLLPR